MEHMHRQTAELSKVLKTLLMAAAFIIFFSATIASADQNTGRFFPSHAIVEPVYCGSCHEDQVRELNETTHLSFFTKALYANANRVLAGTGTEFTQAQAVSGACMMCHSTWNNRDKIYIAGYRLSKESGDYNLTYNDVAYLSDGTVAMYGVPASETTIRLGSNVLVSKVLVQSGSLPLDSVLGITTDYALNGTTGIDLIQGNNISLLRSSDGMIKIQYKVVNPETTTVTYKQAWGDLSAVSPSTGYVFNDLEGKVTCGNLEKGSCHVISNAVAYALASTPGTGENGNGKYFQHEFAYTSTEYEAKQVKMCGVCHTQKLPPMTADGEPIRAGNVQQVRIGDFITSINVRSNEWAHQTVQCVRCHAHAGIGRYGVGANEIIKK